MFQVMCLVVVLAAKVSALSDLSDIPGRYCETRSVQCCQAREDECYVPIMGTLCYCDQFCDRTHNDDCCPDYAYVCRNATRPTPRPSDVTLGCLYKGRYYPEGSAVKINCNNCKCQRVCPTPGSCRSDLACSQDRCLVDPAAITSTNQDRLAGWKATNYTQFWGRTLDEGFTRRLGTRQSKRRAYQMRPINVFDRERVKGRLWYDLRQEKPGMISPPLDQGWCAADWVVSTVQVATDRLALVSKGEDRTYLSPQHLLSCNAKNQRGCDGGHLTRAWKFVQKFGLVPEECYPWTGRQTNCSVSKVKDKRKTTARCANGNSEAPLHRTGPAYRVAPEPEAIMHEIMVSGPVQATMRVTQDFFTYRNGVYQCPRDMRGRRGDNYHAVRVVGWGEEVQNGRVVKYWIVSNSWGQWWGENGYFRIVRGTNECEIESLVFGAWINPIVPKKDPSMPMMDKTNMISFNL